MLEKLPVQLSQLLSKFSRLMPDGTHLYLVGGAVRDLLLGREVHDLDMVLSGDVLQISRYLADSIGAAYYPLDEARQTARIIYQNPEGQRTVFDLAALRADDLVEDLKVRDFTINAMALDLSDADKLIDPLGGAGDLVAKRLRACSPNSLQDDPVRVLRAIRLAFEFQMKILPETLTLMKRAVPLLTRVSMERLRDELFRILGSDYAASAVRMLDHIGGLVYLLPELEGLKGIQQSPPHIHDVWEHTLDVLKRLPSVLNVLGRNYHPDKSSNLAVGLVAMRLGRYRSQINDHLETTHTTERTARSLLGLAALYHDIAKPSSSEDDPDGRIRFYGHDQAGAKVVIRRAHQLRLSNNESDRLGMIVGCHMRPMLLAQLDNPPSRRAVYRFFRSCGPAGVDVCLLSMADFLGTYGPGLPQAVWSRHLDVIRTLLEGWWENKTEVVSPPPLLNGKHLIDRFGLHPGPQIGKLLKALQEAQAVGDVSTVDQAYRLIEEMIDTN